MKRKFYRYAGNALCAVGDVLYHVSFPAASWCWQRATQLDRRSWWR